MAITIFRLPRVIEITGISRARIYQLQRQGNFPQSRRLAGGRSVGWRSDEILVWIKAQPRSRSAA